MRSLPDAAGDRAGAFETVVTEPPMRSLPDATGERDGRVEAVATEPPMRSPCAAGDRDGALKLAELGGYARAAGRRGRPCRSVEAAAADLVREPRSGRVGLRWEAGPQSNSDGLRTVARAMSSGPSFSHELTSGETG